MGFIKRGLNPLFRRLPIHMVKPQIVELHQFELLKGRTALITGGTSGIGNAIAKAYLKAGATVVITGRNQNRVDAALESIRSGLGGVVPVFGIELDMMNPASFERKHNELLNLVPSGQVDILVNNAGVSSDSHAATREIEWDSVMSTNLKGVYSKPSVCSLFQG